MTHLKHKLCNLLFHDTISFGDDDGVLRAPEHVEREISYEPRKDNALEQFQEDPADRRDLIFPSHTQDVSFSCSLRVPAL